MIDLKDFTVDELISIFTADTTDDEPREMTNREWKASKLTEKIALDYLTLTRDKRILELPIPLYSVVYAVTEERAFDYESGKQPICDNQFECPGNCELDGKECRMMPFIEQKIYVPNSIWFTYISKYWGQTVFGTFKEAVKYINDKYGLDFCKESGLPTIDENDTLNIPGLDPDSDFVKAYTKETFGNPVLPKADASCENNSEKTE